MKLSIKIIGGVIGFVLFLFIFSISLEYMGLVKYGIIKPKQEEIRREIYEETQSYVEGKRQAASKYYREYQKSKSQDDKEAILVMVSIDFANFDESKLSPIIRKFVKLAKYGD